MEIEVIWEAAPADAAEREFLEKSLREGVAAALRLGGGPAEAAVCVLVADDARLLELNRQYRGQAKATDVLSFAQREDGAGEPAIADDADATLGDIVVSLERAAAQGEEYGHGLRRELVFLAVHGALHLLGFDHGAETAAETAVMRGLEKQIMESL